MSTQSVEVAVAILYTSGRFLMQLRNNIPGIIYPGHWGFFGGHLDPGETPEEAVIRELQEEIGYTPPRISKFDCYGDEKVLRHVFHAPLTVGLEQLILTEGEDMGLLTPEQIQSGRCYCAKIDQVRPLGLPHRQILLDFIDSRPRT
jgi:8-oxo-dGTP pyrophosphatase MutT (NUDIX family)